MTHFPSSCSTRIRQTASHSRLVLPAHVSLSLQIAAGPLNTRDGECIIDARCFPRERSHLQISSGPPRAALLRQAETQSYVRLYRCGAIKLSATSSARRDSKTVRRGTLLQLFCGT